MTLGLCVCVCVCPEVRWWCFSLFVLISLCCQFFFPAAFAQQLYVKQPSVAQSQIEMLDAAKVRKASELLSDRQAACSLFTSQTLYFHVTALVDVLVVTVILNPALQLLYVVTGWDWSWKDVGYCSCRCSLQRSLLDFNLDFLFKTLNAVCSGFSVLELYVSLRISQPLLHWLWPLDVKFMEA